MLLIIDAIAERRSKVSKRSLESISDGLFACILNGLVLILLIDARTRTHILVVGSVLELDANLGRVRRLPPFGRWVHLEEVLFD